VPLSLYACREKNYKTCEDDLADHGTHLKTQPAGPFTNNSSQIPNNKDAPIPPLVSIQFVRCHKIPALVCPNASPSNSMKVLSLHPIPYSLSPLPYSPPLCYNHRAVERAARWGLAQVQADPAQAAVQSAVPLQVSPIPVARTEHPSRYCPACSQRLESRRCKLICSVCGYYMSCADYY